MKRICRQIVNADRQTQSSTAVIATLNGIIVHMISIWRVLYGLAHEGSPAKGVTRVKARTGTVILATGLDVGAILLRTVETPVSACADLTARCTPLDFATVNMALLRIKSREASPPAGIFLCPTWVPAAGLISSVGLLALDLVVR